MTDTGASAPAQSPAPSSTCPRRTGEPGPWDRTEGLDPFRADGTCSFCGSISAEKLFAAIESSAE